MNNLHVKTGDTAVVLSGKEKGKRGKVLSVDPKKGMVVIEGGEHGPSATPSPAARARPADRRARGRRSCLQGHEGLPEVQQADPSGTQVC